MLTIVNPRRIPNSSNADTTKHYKYHCSYGDTTEDFFILKEKIEDISENLSNGRKEDSLPRENERGDMRNNHKGRTGRGEKRGPEGR